MDRYKCVDLFCGCGGFSEGFKKAGFEIVLANEIDENFACIYKKNNPGTTVMVGDIRKIKEEMVSLLKDTKIDVVIGGFPCQAFSSSGLRDPNDPRAFLYKEFLWMVDKIKPVVFVGENVKGMLSARKPPENLTPETKKAFDLVTMKMRRVKELKRSRRQAPLPPEEEKELASIEKNHDRLVEMIERLTVPIVPAIRNEIKTIGYSSVFKILNSANFGVPQKRERAIIIGSIYRIGNDIFPDEDHFNRSHLEQGMTSSLLEGPIIHPFKTVDDAIKDLEDMKEDENYGHIFSTHSPDFLEKIKSTKQGESVFGNFKESYYRLVPDKIAPTVMEHHSGVFLHPRKDRLLSPRELARLQSFDDSFILKGKKSHLLTVIGNAVPPLMAYRISVKIKQYILHQQQTRA